MTSQTELDSWKWGNLKGTPSPVPEVGSKAPTSTKLPLPHPNGKPTIIVFLRHCGCPFAEKTFQLLRDTAKLHKEVNFVAVSHSDQPSTDRWVVAVGGEWDVQVVVDSDREVYQAWGLGVSSAWHVLNPWSMYSVFKLASASGSEKIVNRPTESGTRWQKSGAFAVSQDGTVTCVQVAKAADFIPNFNEALKSVGVDS